MASYTTGRHNFARGPVTEEIKQKLVAMIERSEGKIELLAEDIIEIMAVCRNDKEGFRAANTEIDRLLSEYQES